MFTTRRGFVRSDMVAVAQLVRAPVCGTGGRGFNSPRSPSSVREVAASRTIHVQPRSTSVADVTVTDAGPHEKLISFEVAEAELEPAKNAAARKISQEVKIRGFRPGKAPRAIVEATVGAERLRSEAIDEMLPRKVGDLLTELEIEPAVSPALESIEDSLTGVKVEVRVTTWRSTPHVRAAVLA